MVVVVVVAHLIEKEGEEEVKQNIWRKATTATADTIVTAKKEAEQNLIL